MSERDFLSRAIGALGHPPPAPDVDFVWEGVGAADARSRARRVGAGIAAGFLAAGLLVAVLVASSLRDMDSTYERPETTSARSEAPHDVQLGKAVQAQVPERRGLGGRALLDLDAGARVVATSLHEVEQHAGRVHYNVEHATGKAFTVRAGGVEIVDVGTRFAVDVAPFAGTSVRVLVTVDHGEVSAGGVALRAGRGVAFVDGKAMGEPWPLDARPVVGVETEGAAQAGLPIVVRVSLENPTDGWLTLPERDGLRAPLFLEVRGPDGVVRPVRVTESMILETGGPGTAIPPRGRVVVRVRFDVTFASPGTYRLRAVYRPADAVDAPASPETTLTVR